MAAKKTSKKGSKRNSQSTKKGKQSKVDEELAARRSAAATKAAATRKANREAKERAEAKRAKKARKNALKGWETRRKNAGLDTAKPKKKSIGGTKKPKKTLEETSKKPSRKKIVAPKPTEKPKPSRVDDVSTDKLEEDFRKAKEEKKFREKALKDAGKVIGEIIAKEETERLEAIISNALFNATFIGSAEVIKTVARLAKEHGLSVGDIWDIYHDNDYEAVDGDYEPEAKTG